MTHITLEIDFDCKNTVYNNKLSELSNYLDKGWELISSTPVPVSCGGRFARGMILYVLKSPSKEVLEGDIEERIPKDYLQIFEAILEKCKNISIIDQNNSLPKEKLLHDMVGLSIEIMQQSIGTRTSSFHLINSINYINKYYPEFELKSLPEKIIIVMSILTNTLKEL